MRIPEAVESVRRYMRHLAPDRGWVEGTTEYTKFILLGRSRTGSNLLRSLLNGHSRVEAYGEVFRSRESMDWDHIGYLGSENMQRLLQKDPVKLLEKQIFRRYPLGTGAVGFKIFYYHAHDRAWEPIWDYLRERRDLHILHMVRRNILATHVSRKRAEVTDSWVNTTGEKQAAPLVTLDYDECLEDFRRTRALELEYGRFFADQPKLTVTYEDLSRNHAEEMNRVFAFLGLESEPVEPKIYKQSNRPLSEMVTNFTELAQRFAGSPWAAFFSEFSVHGTAARDKEA